MIKREIQSQIEKWLFKRKIIIIYGARQVGKTTLSKVILKRFEEGGKYLNCDLLSVKQALETTNEKTLKSFIGSAKVVVLDEAQRIKNIGLVLKILIDTYPEIQVIATGSSSFDLANEIAEPLTGRFIRFILYPLSLQEILYEYDRFKLESSIEQIMRFGTYPKVFTSSEEDAKIELDSIASNYLYKDILSFQKIKKSNLLTDLLQLLALQLGSEISHYEIAQNLGISSLTVEKYLDLLEKTFIIFKLRSFSRNLRKEISKSFKIYFYDLGIRNDLIQNYNTLRIRSDVGGLWENFCIIERLKFNQANERGVNKYFWRTYDQKEIDYVEESAGKLEGFEFKWGKGKKYKPPLEFLRAYPNSTVKRIDQSNYGEFLLEA